MTVGSIERSALNGKPKKAIVQCARCPRKEEVGWRAPPGTSIAIEATLPPAWVLYVPPEGPRVEGGRSIVKTLCPPCAREWSEQRAAAGG